MQPTILGLTVGPAIAIGLAISLQAGQQQTAEALRLSDAPAGAIWIDSLNLSQATIRRPRAAAGQPTPPPALKLSLGGLEYVHGVPLNVNTDLAIDLKGAATRFTSMVGIDDLRKSGVGSATFDVWVDGKLATSSGIVKSGEMPKLLRSIVTGAKQLILAVNDAGDGRRDDDVIWGGALLELAQGSQHDRR